MKPRVKFLAAILKLGLLLFVFFLIPTGCEKPPTEKDPEIESPAKGTLVVAKVFSPSLENNLLSDPSTRNVSIYLPPGYDTESTKSYPVLYLLHAFMCDHDTWFGGQFTYEYGEEGNEGLFMKKILDTLIQKEIIRPLIVVCPSSFTTYDGSWYSNSIVSGHWEDFIVEDLVAYVDANYRTLPAAESRGIAGHSMGAHGSMKLALKHPEVFSSVYAMSGTAVSIATLMDIHKQDILEAMQITRYDKFILLPWQRIPISMAVAMAPNPSLQPFQGEFPYDMEGNKVDSTWQKWLKHDPAGLLEAYLQKEIRLKSIRFDCGTQDGALLSNQVLSEALSKKGIAHEFDTYSGDHNNMIPARLAAELLPYFSSQLEHSGD